MKNKFLKIGMTVALMVIAHRSDAQVLYGNSRQLVNSAATTNTAVNFPAFPCYVASSSGITNLVGIPLPYGFSQVSIQVQGQSASGTATSNVVWTVFKSVTGGSPTNAPGGNLILDTVGYITNTLAGSTTTATVATYGVDGKAASASQSSDIGIAGIPMLYIGAIQVVASSVYTNYAAYVNIK